MNDDNAQAVLERGARLLEEFAQKDCQRARQKMQTAPLMLTDADFVTLHNHGDEGEAGKAYEARRLAQLEIVRSCGGSHSSTTQSAPLETKAIKPRAAPPETIEEFNERYGTKAVTYQALSGVLDVYTDGLKNHRAALEKLKAALDTLAQQNKALSDRLVELEAREAVTHAD